jgi:hypothetical protein
MKMLSYTTSKIRSHSLAMVAFMILMVLAQQAYISHQQSIIGQEIASAASSQNENSDAEPQTTFDVDHNIIASSIQFSVSHAFYEIMDIIQDEEEDNFHNIELTSFPDDYRKVLFCQVISPNAP